MDCIGLVPHQLHQPGSGTRLQSESGAVFIPPLEVVSTVNRRRRPLGTINPPPVRSRASAVTPGKGATEHKDRRVASEKWRKKGSMGGREMETAGERKRGGGWSVGKG